MTTRAAGVRLLTAAALLALALGGAMTAHGGDDAETRADDDALVARLDADDGAARAEATAEVFRRGRAALPALERAGAKPMATLRPPRRDVVYSLLLGNAPGRYRTDSFGLHLAGPSSSAAAVARLGARHGFVLPPGEPVRAGASPSCYVRLSPGKGLFTVLRSLLSTEPDVVTVNLNYTEE